jgi:hypothetical protein
VSVAPQVARVLGRGPRPPCSDAERRAAGRVRAWLSARGDPAEVTTVWMRPQRLAVLGLASALGVAGSLLAVAVPVAGLACAAVAALWLAAGVVPPSFPRRATQDVVVAPHGAGPVALLVCARYDCDRAGLAARGRGVAERLRRRGLPGVRGWLVLSAAAVAGAAVARVAGVDGTWLGALQLPPTAALLVAAGAALDGGLAGWEPGARSAAAAAVAVAIHDELAQQPPDALSPGLVLYGAGAGGPGALRAQLKALAPERGRVVVLEVLPLGAGPARWRTSHQQLRAAAERAAGALALPKAPPLPRKQRLGRVPVVRIGAGATGEPDDAALTAAVDLGLAIADALDAAVAEGLAPR